MFLHTSKGCGKLFGTTTSPTFVEFPSIQTHPSVRKLNYTDERVTDALDLRNTVSTIAMTDKLC